MNKSACLTAALLCAALTYPAYSAVSAVDVAKAYVQAITDGTGPKVAGSVDYVALGCTSATVWDANSCQKAVFNGKDGKTLLMESITNANIEQLVPVADVRRVYDLGNPAHDDVRLMFYDLSTKGSGFYPTLDGNGKAKAILQAQIESTGPGGMYGNFTWPFDAAPPQTAKMTGAGIDFQISTLPTAASLDVARAPLYFWALQTDMSDMAYPAGFVFPPDFHAPNGNPPEFCSTTTAAWGHVGVQYSKNDPSTPTLTQRKINWGGGGDGSGKDDYGCGGSNVSAINWQANTWYTYKVARGTKRGPKLWEWNGSVVRKSGSAVIYTYRIFGGEYLTWATTWSELINVRCTEAKMATQWANPYYINSAGKFRVGRVNFSYGGDGCLRSKEAATNVCTAKWSQNQGAANQNHAAASLLRQSNSADLIEQDCERKADATEISIGKAYIQAISGGTGAKSVSAAIDYTALGCTNLTVYDANCQQSVFNGRDGKTVLMESITSSPDGTWQASNVQTLIPLDAMQRIKHDSRYAQALDILNNMASTPDWYPYLAGVGKAKDVLQKYMLSVN